MKITVPSLKKFLDRNSQNSVNVIFRSQEDRSRKPGKYQVHFNYFDGNDWMGTNYFGDNVSDLLAKVKELPYA